MPYGDFEPEEPYFYRHELNKLKRYFNDRYFLRMWISLGSKLDEELGNIGFNTSNSILIRYGFHYQENRSVMNGEEQEYLQLFPYAPKVVREGRNPYNGQSDDLLLTYAGCFSLTFYSLEPLYGREGMRYWPPGLSAAKSLEQLKSTPIFYHELKQGLEKIFNQPMDVFIGVW